MLILNICVAMLAASVFSVPAFFIYGAGGRRVIAGRIAAAVWLAVFIVTLWKLH
jgi:hypothetical protein